MRLRKPSILDRTDVLLAAGTLMYQRRDIAAPGNPGDDCQSLTFLDSLKGMCGCFGTTSMGMNVNLTPQLEDLVRSKVSSGLYTSASEVVREALRLMQEQDRLREARLEELRREVRRGLNGGPGEEWNATDLKAKARTKRASKSVAT